MRRATQSVEQEHAGAMEQAERQRAKAQLVAVCWLGNPGARRLPPLDWRSAGVPPTGSPSGYAVKGRELSTKHHGHPSKMSVPVQQWLITTCRDTPCQSGQMLQAALQERFGLTVSIGHLNAMRARLGISRRSRCTGEHGTDDSASH